MAKVKVEVDGVVQELELVPAPDRPGRLVAWAQRRPGFPPVQVFETDAPEAEQPPAEPPAKSGKN